MNNKGKVSIVGLLLGLVTFALFTSILVYSIVSTGDVYDTTGFNETEFSDKYVYLSQMDNELSDSRDVLNTTVDGNAFDVFGQWFKEGVKGVKAVWSGIGFIGDSTGLVSELSSDAVGDFGLPQFWTTYISAVIVIFIVIGFFILNYLMKVGK